MHELSANHRCHVSSISSCSVFAVLLLALLLGSAQATQPAVLLGTIPVGLDFPCGIAVNAVTNRVYVTACADPGHLIVIDGATNEVIATTQLDKLPLGVGVNPTTNKIYVAGGGTNEVLVISGDTNQIFRRIATGIGTSSELAIDELNNRIYVGADFARILVVDGDTDQIVATISTADDPPRGIAVNSDTGRLYVANLFSQSIQVIDTSDLNLTTTIPLDGGPNSIVIDRNTNLVYATVGLDKVVVINGETNAIITSIPLGFGVSRLALNPATNSLYVTHEIIFGGGQPSSLSIIDTATNSVVQVIAVGIAPRGVAANVVTNRVYVANTGDGTQASWTVSVLSGGTSLPLIAPVDIKPGSFPNTINLGSHGSVRVAIISTDAFDATTVDPLTVTLASSPIRLTAKGSAMASFVDVNTDGRLDLVVHVITESLELSDTDTLAVLVGRTFSGSRIQGRDSVRVVP